MENDTKKIKLSKVCYRALTIIRDRPGISPRYFAEYMWPDSEGWRHNFRGGGGTQRGKGMWLCAGGYLKKLAKKGLINWSYRDIGISLTYQAKELLKERHK